MIQKLLRKFYKIQTGLNPLPEDERDLGFSFAKLFGTDYAPKHDKHILELPFPAEVQRYNSCGWFNSTDQREYDEQVQLDPRVTVIFGRQAGMISGDGFSNLRDNEKILLDKGCAERNTLNHRDNGTWEDYSNPKYLTQAIVNNAYTHRIKSFSRIYKVAEVYQALDQGRTVAIGLSWRTSFNMSGGFADPWIINFNKGYLVGGHKVYIYGYDKNYRLAGNKCFKVRNSYGSDYGDNGSFWIREADLQGQIDLYGAYVNLDLDKDILSWLREHQGWVVKAENNPDVFLIQGDKKRKYDDMATMTAHGKLAEEIVTVDKDYLDKVTLGEPIRFWDGGNIKAVKAIIQQRPDLKELYSKYFSELFS